MRAIDVAKYLIAKTQNAGDLITNKKLQKILYYVKAWGLVYFEDGVIDDPFEAWVHGPVCRSVYSTFNKFKYDPVSLEYKNGETSSMFIRAFIASHSSSEIERRKVAIVDSIYLRYIGFSAAYLEEMTHNEKPWVEARNGCAPEAHCSKRISERTMAEFYHSQMFPPKKVVAKRMPSNFDTEVSQRIGGGFSSEGMSRKEVTSFLAQRVGRVSSFINPAWYND